MINKDGGGQFLGLWGSLQPTPHQGKLWAPLVISQSNLAL